MRFVQNGVNEILDCGEFYISYNPSRVINPMDAIGVKVGVINEANVGRPETAIFVGDTSKFFILYGDYREAYMAIAQQGLDACITLFMKHIEHITDTSDRPETINH